MPFKARGSSNYASPCIFCIRFEATWKSLLFGAHDSTLRKLKMHFLDSISEESDVAKCSSEAYKCRHIKIVDNYESAVPFLYWVGTSDRIQAVKYLTRSVTSLPKSTRIQRYTKTELQMTPIIAIFLIVRNAQFVLGRLGFVVGPCCYSLITCLACLVSFILKCFKRFF